MRRDFKQPRKPTTILLGTENPKPSPDTTAHPPKPAAANRDRVKAYCPYCDNNRHFLNGCENFKLLSKEQKVIWIKGQNRCWRCGRGHHAANCTLRALCPTCNRKHLQALHDVNEQSRATEEAVPASAVLYVDRQRVMTKFY